MSGSLSVVGLGPGGADTLTPEAAAALHGADALYGYGPYLAARPQTLGFGFTDSPVAQLAYLVERFKEFDGWGSAVQRPTAQCGLSGIRWAYTRSVNAAFACPSHSATTFTRSPTSSSADA